MLQIQRKLISHHCLVSTVLYHCMGPNSLMAEFRQDINRVFFSFNILGALMQQILKVNDWSLCDILKKSAQFFPRKYIALYDR